MTMEQEEERQALLRALAAAISSGTGTQDHKKIGTGLHRVVETSSTDDSSPLTDPSPKNGEDPKTHPSPAEMAAELGVTLAELPGVLKQRITELTTAMQELENHLMVAPGLQPNRAQRRAAKFNKPGAAIMKNGRWVAR